MNVQVYNVPIGIPYMHTIYADSIVIIYVCMCVYKYIVMVYVRRTLYVCVCVYVCVRGANLCIRCVERFEYRQNRSPTEWLVHVVLSGEG